MNWLKDSLKFIAYLSLSVGIGCGLTGGDSSTVTLKGTLFSSDPLVQITQAPLPTISVQGKGESAFPIEVVTKESSSTQLVFKMKDLPLDETFLFSVSQSGRLDPTLSFPIHIVKNYPLKLAAVPIGTLDIIKALAQTKGYPTTALKGMIVGLITPQGTGCAPYRSVGLVDGAGIVPSDASPALYFDSDQQIQTTAFSDTSCTYVFVNVPSGSYTLQFKGDTGELLQEIDVTVIESRASFGYDVP